MRSSEARAILHDHLELFRALSFAELQGLLPASPLVGDRIAPSGTRYEIEVRLQLEAEDGIRVAGAIDDAGWRALAPLREEFVVRPTPRGAPTAPAAGSE